MTTSLEHFYQAQNDLARDPSILEKYEKASSVANQALQILVSKCLPGAHVPTLRREIDLFIQREARSANPAAKSTLEHGLAIPTVICRNNQIVNWAPYEDQSQQPEHLIVAGDLIKVEVGCQIDGYISIGGGTFVAGQTQPNATGPITGRVADLLVASHCIELAIEGLLRPGPECIPRIYKAINKICRMYSCNPVTGIDSFQIKRYILDGDKFIPSVLDDSFSRFKQQSVEVGDVFCINVCISTGAGSNLVTNAEDCTIFNRNAAKNVNMLKLATSNQLVKKVDDVFGVFPFCFGMLPDAKKLKFGLKECLDTGILRTNPCIKEQEGEMVAQVRFTVVVGEDGSNKRLTQRLATPYAHSEFVFQDDELAQIIAQKSQHN